MLKRIIKHPIPYECRHDRLWEVGHSLRPIPENTYSDVLAFVNTETVATFAGDSSTCILQSNGNARYQVSFNSCVLTNAHALASLLAAVLLHWPIHCSSTDRTVALGPTLGATRIRNMRLCILEVGVTSRSREFTNDTYRTTANCSEGYNKRAVAWQPW